MNNIYYDIKLLFKRLLIVLIAYQYSRLLFFIFNYKQFTFNNSFFYILKDFFFGLRFDIAIISIINILYVILFFFFINNRKADKFLKWFFVVTNSVFLLINFVDIEYFKFTNKRSTFDLLKLILIGDDMKNLSWQFIFDFWYILLFYISSIFLLIKFYAKNNNNSDKIKKIISYSLSVIFIPIMILFYRGVTLKPLSIIDAAKYTRAENIPLVLNSSFTFIRTSFVNEIKTHKYFKNNQEVKKYFTTKHKYNNTNFNKKNVIIFILESFGKEYTGYFNSYTGYTPFLDSLIDKSLYSDYSFANGKKSIEAVPSIISSIPSLMTEPFINSPYSSNNISSLAKILNNEGYKTLFFHGGNNGTMSFDKFASLAGISLYYGRKQYPFPDRDYDGNWGIFDEPYLQYFAKELDKNKKPFFATIFTLSSHHPYTIPDKYKNKFKGGKLEIYKAVEYADYSLKLFFNTAKKMSWFKNTLFVFVADHTSISEHQFYKTNYGTFCIPILFYSPTDTNLAKKTNKIIQQIDIMPSVLDYLGYNKTFLAFGKSIFSEKNNFAVNYINGLYQIIKDGYLLQFNGEESIALYNINTDKMLENNIIKENKQKADSLEKYLKAEIQTYDYELKNNKTNL